ncbi:helix-turn-helix domain-containing protein [Bacillus sp. 3255]|uniref:helix-turn-helix domain-containing protein n=1 Tax=Bacillus sp. 3255 TaxID=2817904 RepID=UPI00285F3E1F|nr:helix-turn-helix domain-containing protein [Bacillus sp. 3255]MDR6880390.1 excisionase family DNA binding protein [Bacillus sp. 3255]
MDQQVERKTLTVDEIASYLGVHRDSVYTMVRKKEIPHFKVGARILFRMETIESWMKQQESQNHRFAQ